MNKPIEYQVEHGHIAWREVVYRLRAIVAKYDSGEDSEVDVVKDLRALLNGGVSE